MKRTTGIATFRTATALAQLLYQAEHLYTGQFAAEEREDYVVVVGRLAGQLRRRLSEYWTLVHGDRQDARYVRAMEQVKIFANHAVACGAAPNPHTGIGEWDTEFAYERRSYRKHNGRQPQALVTVVSPVFADGDLGPLFKLVFLLTAELYPTLWGGQRLRSPVDEAMFISERLVPSVQILISRLGPDLTPRLPECWHLSKFSHQARLTEIQKLLAAIKNAIVAMSPPSLYLGLVLDRARGRIGRSGKWQPFPHRTRWVILQKLAEARGTAVRREVLLNELNKNNHLSTPSNDHAVVVAISDIRPALKALGLQIKCQQQIGYKLGKIDVQTRRGREKTKAKRS